jgi:hypothetical protein
MPISAPSVFDLIHSLGRARERFKPYDPNAGNRPCEECGAPTREGKPYCSDHVDHMPYAQRLMDDIARREAETDDALKGGPIGTHIFLVILGELRMAPVDGLGRLSKRIDLPYPIVRRAVSTLIGERKVRITPLTERKVRIEAVPA